MILVVSPAAATDLDGLWAYLEAHADQAMADRVIDTVAARCELIASVPYAGRVRPELGEGVRSLIVEHHVIYYRVDEHAVVVARVLHERRDQVGTFFEGEGDAVSLFPDSSATTLRALAAALRAGGVSVPLSSFAVQRHAPRLSDAAAHVLGQLSEEGISPGHLALLLEQCADAIDAQLHAAGDIEFVWTGLEGDHAHVRDTAVVVAELFAQAEHNVIVSSYVVYQGAKVIESLARRMDERPELLVRLFHVGREERDVRRCASSRRARCLGSGATRTGSVAA